MVDSELTPIPAIRFSLRLLFLLMTVVAVATLSLTLMHRRVEFTLQAKLHRQQEFAKVVLNADQDFQTWFWPRYREYQDYHRQMAEKYEHAASRPWLSVEPDPVAPPDVDKLSRVGPDSPLDWMLVPVLTALNGPRRLFPLPRLRD